MSANVYLYEKENFLLRAINGDGGGKISIRPSFPLIHFLSVVFFFIFVGRLTQRLFRSLFLILPPPDKPICRSEQKRIYGVARNEAAEILCEVDAYPPPESFKWSFNNTAETFEMPQSDYRIHSSQASTLSYTPVKVSGGVMMFLKLFIRPSVSRHIASSCGQQYGSCHAMVIYLGAAAAAVARMHAISFAAVLLLCIWSGGLFSHTHTCIHTLSLLKLWQWKIEQRGSRKPIEEANERASEHKMFEFVQTTLII
jgi:hypothetical protein